MDISRFLQTQGLPLNTSQLEQCTRRSWQLLYVKSIFPIVLKSSVSALSARSSQQQQQKKKNSSSGRGWRKKHSGNRGREGVHRFGSPKVFLHSITPAPGGRSQLCVSLTWLVVRRSYASLYSRSKASAIRQWLINNMNLAHHCQYICKMYLFIYLCI